MLCGISFELKEPELAMSRRLNCSSSFRRRKQFLAKAFCVRRQQPPEFHELIDLLILCFPKIPPVLNLLTLSAWASPAMFPMLLSFLRSFPLYFQSRADLQIEILALRHQIVVLQRQTPKPKLKSV